MEEVRLTFRRLDFEKKRVHLLSLKANALAMQCTRCSCALATCRVSFHIDDHLYPIVYFNLKVKSNELCFMLLFLFQNSISTLVTAVAPIFGFQHDKAQHNEDNDDDDNDYFCNSYLFAQVRRCEFIISQNQFCLKRKSNAF